MNNDNQQISARSQKIRAQTTHISATENHFIRFIGILPLGILNCNQEDPRVGGVICRSMSTRSVHGDNNDNQGSQVDEQHWR